MKKLSKTLIITVLSMFLVAGTAMALPVNIRPVALPGESLQDQFDGNDYGKDISAADDQLTTAYWTLTQGSIASNMVLYFEADPSSENAVAFGIYDLSTEPHLAEVFSAGNTAVASANVEFNNNSTALVIQLKDADKVAIAQNEYTFMGTTFGFYIAEGGTYDANAEDYGYSNVLFSDDTMNKGGVAALLAYNADPGSYIFAGDIDGNGDFCDIITHAESIKASMPEPATMLLLGSGLIGLASFGRKKLLFRKG